MCHDKVNIPDLDHLLVLHYFCSHEHMEHPGKYEERPTAEFTGRDLEERAFTVGLGGPVGRCVK